MAIDVMKKASQRQVTRAATENKRLGDQGEKLRAYCIQLPPSIHTALKTEAAQRHTSIGALVEAAVRSYLDL